MWSRDNDGAKLIDFGRAQRLDASSSTTTKHRMGTHGFQAPEIDNGSVHTVASDTYSVGRILWHAVDHVRNDLFWSVRDATQHDGTDGSSGAPRETTRMASFLEDVSNRLSNKNPRMRLMLGDALEEVTAWNVTNKDVSPLVTNEVEERPMTELPSTFRNGEESPPHKIPKLIE